MNLAIQQLARMLRTKPEVLDKLAIRMEKVTGKTGIYEKIIQENNDLINQTLDEFDVPKDNRTADNVYQALLLHLLVIDKDLYEYLNRPDLSKLSYICGKLCEIAFKLKDPGKGYFIKKDKAIEMLESFPPQNLLDHFGYSTVYELVEKEGFASVFASLRFAQDNEWMHTFFDKPYRNLVPDDFEERNVEMIVLDHEWLKIAEKFMKNKYHNVSHLKEYGIIFITPVVVDGHGKTLRMFTLLLHYLNEVPFYSNLFRIFAKGDKFIPSLQSLLRGDVPEGQVPPAIEGKTFNLRIIQQYLAKHDENDFRLLEPHVNPEAEHWYRAAGDLAKMNKLNLDKRFDYTRWQKLDHVSGFFPDNTNNTKNRLISFDLIDLVMSLVIKGEIKYLYHQEEALWNRIFIEYLGRDQMNKLIDENIVRGFITL